jgi:hypothetical protein
MDNKQTADTLLSNGELFLLFRRTWNTLQMCDSVDGQGERNFGDLQFADWIEQNSSLEAKVLKLLEKIVSLYETLRFVTMFPKIRHWSLS